MSHGVILGQTPALPADVADKNYVDNAIGNLSNNLTNTINNAISSLESRLKNYVNNAIAGIGSGDMPIAQKINIYSTNSTYSLGPYPKTPKFVYIFAGETLFRNSNSQHVFINSILVPYDSTDWRYVFGGVNFSNAGNQTHASGRVGTSYWSGGNYYIRCEKSSFEGTDFWDLDGYRNAYATAFF